MSLRHDIVTPSLDDAGIPSLVALAFPDQLVIPWVLDSRTSARTLVQITCFDATADARLFADLCEVPPSKRTAMLELSNAFNARYRWVKSTIAEEQLLLGADIFIGQDGQAPLRFQAGFRVFVEALQNYWPDVSRVLSQRGRRTRLEREVAGLLLRHSG